MAKLGFKTAEYLTAYSRNAAGQQNRSGLNPETPGHRLIRRYINSDKREESMPHTVQ